MQNKDDRGIEEVELWSFGPVDTYEIPAAALRVGTIRKRLSELRERVRKKNRRVDSPLDAEEDLLSLKDPELSKIAPEPDWPAAADALHERLAPWLDAEEPAKPVVFYVAPPFGGREEILHAWASKYGIDVRHRRTAST